MSEIPPKRAVITGQVRRRSLYGFHTFAIQWAPQSVTFYVAGAAYHTVTPSLIPAGTRWVFDAPFFLLLNVAVGGRYPGPPDVTTQLPQDMVIDYVRYTAALGSTAR